MMPLCLAGDCLPKVLINNWRCEEDGFAYDNSDNGDLNEVIICNSCKINVSKLVFEYIFMNTQPYVS